MELFTENQKTSLKLPLYLAQNVLSAQGCNMLKIILIEAGSAVFCIDRNSDLLSNKSIVISAPALLCLNEKEDFKAEKGSCLTTKIINFAPSLINSCFNNENIYWNSDSFPDTTKLDHFYFRPFTDRNSLSFGQLNIGFVTLKKISTLYDSLKEQLDKKDDNFWPCRNRSYLIEILFLIQHCYSQTDFLNINLPEVSTAVNDIILYLHLNYSNKITIAELTKEFHTNRNSLNNRFKKDTGFSVMEYIVRLRIGMACTLLRDTSLPISEIMEKVGFIDKSYWGRAFKKLAGTTPTDFRKTTGGHIQMGI